MPTWVKAAIDSYTSTAGVADGHVFRAVNPIREAFQPNDSAIGEGGKDCARALLIEANRIEVLPGPNR
jgi:hypothetical protein